MSAVEHISDHEVHQNHGVLVGQRATDYAAGTLKYEVRVHDGNWLPYLVEKERQHSNTTDSMGCVSFSGNTVIEMQIKQQTGVEVNLSDRFLAKMSGTTVNGNWLYIVADTIRKYGVPLESQWPKPPGNSWGWNEYYSPIPASVINQAKWLLDEFAVEYEALDIYWKDRKFEIEKHLKHCPLWIVIPGHAVAGVILKVNQNTVTYFDTYGEPFLKETPITNIQSIYKLVVTKKGHTMAKVLNDNGTIRLEFGSGPTGFNIGIASASLFKQIEASGEPILNQPATTPERLTLSEGMIIHNK